MKRYNIFGVESAHGPYYRVEEVDILLDGMDATERADKARIADLEQACKENARYSTEMREEFEQRGEEIQKLQKALRFWLPHVPPEDSERGNRIANDTYLLAGYQGEIEADAEERGWIKLTELMGSVTK